MKRLILVMLAMVLAIGCGGNKDNGDGDGTSDGDTDGLDGWDFDPDQIQPDNVDTTPVDLPDVLYEPELCGEANFNISRVIPDVLILLDRSNSMSEPISDPLWNIIRQAIITVTQAMDDSIWFGLMSFPNSVPPNNCSGFNNQCTAPASTSVLVEVGPDTSGAIEVALMSLTTCGGTPIAMSLQSANDYLATLTDDHPKFIILATDGAPNCNEALDGDTCTCTAPTGCWINNLNCLDDTRTYGILDGLCSAGVSTYILGMGGATSWTEVLQGMATHGCTDTPYAVNDPDAIQAALDEIAGAVASCQFELNCADIPDATKVNFYFDGAVVPRVTDHSDGWDWVDICESTTDESGVIEFFGPACDRIMNREVETVTATFGCPTIII